ncbi:MAG TPA: hypothetical protein VHS78_08895 [Candidatus Elarobacter sp.]|nr:hypothetical protein [Candidatus Elarobacter sp.]
MLAIIGFAVTIWQAYGARTAAERASDAANKSRRRIVQIDVLTVYDQLYAQLRELILIHRDASKLPVAVLQRYYAITQEFAAILKAQLDLPADSQHVVVVLQKNLARMLQRLESTGGYPAMDFKKENITLQKIVEALLDAREDLKKVMGREDG